MIGSKGIQYTVEILRYYEQDIFHIKESFELITLVNTYKFSILQNEKKLP